MILHYECSSKYISKNKRIMCEQLCKILKRFLYLRIHVDSISYFCNKLKCQPNLIIWTGLGYFVACSRSFYFRKGVSHMQNGIKSKCTFGYTDLL